MKPFTYYSPQTLDQAIDLYGKVLNPAYIAGGTDLIVKMKEGCRSAGSLISLKKIRQIAVLDRDEATGSLKVGSMVTHRMLETSHMIRQYYPIIHDAASAIGSVQVRNIATIGGNLVNAVPSADGAVPLIALDGVARIAGLGSFRSVRLTDFFVEPYRTVLEPGEILVDIVTAPQEPNTGSGYVKFGRRAAMELPVIGIGVLISLDVHQVRCTRARICLGVAGPTPMRAREAESILEGQIIGERLLSRAGEIAAAESRVRDSLRGKAWHRKEVIRVMVRRLGLRCLRQIQESARVSEGPGAASSSGSGICP